MHAVPLLKCKISQSCKGNYFATARVDLAELTANVLCELG